MQIFLFDNNLSHLLKHHNQENVLFIENKALAKAYSDEFQRLWEYFEVVITKEGKTAGK